MYLNQVKHLRAGYIRGKEGAVDKREQHRKDQRQRHRCSRAKG